MAENQLDVAQDAIIENEPEQPEAAQVPPTEDAPPAVDEKPDPAALQSDVERLQEKKKKLEEDTLYWRQEKAKSRGDYFKGRNEPAPAVAAEKPTAAEPTSDQFDDYDDYTKALTDHRVKAARTEWDRDAQQKANDEVSQRKEVELQSKIQRGFEKYPDFEDIALAETVPITPVIKDILTECENPEDVAYYLGNNRAEAIKISRMAPLVAAREIAKIEYSLAETATEPRKPTTTSAPPVIKPIGSSGATVGKDPENMTQAEFEQYRKSQGAKQY